MNPDSELGRLMTHFARPGRIEWIGVRPRHRAPPSTRDEVLAVTDQGLQGDRYAKAGGKRQVTLIQAEHLPIVAGLVGLACVTPDQVRRNLAVSGINLYALRDRRFRVGSAVLEGTGTCDPCSRMEEVLGYGGYNAMRAHGGITARIVEGGVIRLGAAVEAL